MLVLSRKKDESIVISDNIVITVIEIRGDKVRLGIQAPKTIPVHRSEVHAAIQAENLRASEETSSNAPVFPKPIILNKSTKKEEASVNNALFND